MKFHKERTAIKTDIEGVEQYEEAFLNGTLKRVRVKPTNLRSAPSGAWRVFMLHQFQIRDNREGEPLEVTHLIIQPRALVLDELTRHRSTKQFFIPIVGSFMAVVAESKPDDPDSPDPNSIALVPVQPGEVFEVGIGTWHTLPYNFVGRAIGLSIMHLDSLDSYHDVRDLTAEGWVATLEFEDPKPRSFERKGD